MRENRTIGEQAENTNVGRMEYNSVGKTPMKRGGYEAWLQKEERDDREAERVVKRCGVCLNR